MTLTAAEVLDAAKALPRDERAEVVHELLATLVDSDISDEARMAELRAAVAAGLEQIDRGEGIEVQPEDLRAHIRGLGDEAAERFARRTA